MNICSRCRKQITFSGQMLAGKGLNNVAKVQINKIFEGKIVNIFLPISFNICFGCSKEPSH